MKKRLTLIIDGTVIDSAKKYAKRKGVNLSIVVENYLKTINTVEVKTEKLSPRIAELIGAVKLPDDVDYKQELANALANKYQIS